MEDQEQPLVDDGEVDLPQEVTGSDENEVMQVIVQEDGQIVLPEGQLLQVNSESGQPQFIQLTGEDGQNQLLQLMPDGRAQLIQVLDDNGASQIIQVTQPDELQEDVVGDGTEAIDAEQMEQMEEEAMMLEQTEDGEQLQEVSYVNDPVVILEKDEGTAEEVQDIHAITMEETGELVQEGDMIQEHEQHMLQEVQEPVEFPAEGEGTEIQAHEIEMAAPIDEANPIAVTSDTVVTIGGKKCVLRVDPASNHLVAYPFRAQGRRRGRPKKSDLEMQAASKQGDDEDYEEDEDEQRALSEQENSAAQGLLGLSDSDGVRRSCRVKKKPKLLKGYETGAIDGVDEEEEAAAGEESDDGDSPLKRGRGRPPKYLMPKPPAAPAMPVIHTTANTMQTLLASLGYPVKRGRGRPRRNPLPGMPRPIPAFIIPSSEGKAVMMAPVESLQNSDAIQKATAKVDIVSSGPEHIIIQKSDGTQTQLTVKAKNDIKIEDAKEDDKKEGESEETSEENKDEEKSEETEKNGEEEGSGEKTTTVEESTTVTEENGEVVEKAKSKSAVPAAFIELPTDIIPILLPKKDPVKIGLKAAESDLEKLKCSKCDFQAYYVQQYQEHISKHGQDVHKCKCCMFLAFQKDDLTQHYRENHAKNICTMCDFTAEHAYIIKRHMLRHKANGCECDICGKQYKDQYILKMHVKMVHMPAEVLYGCNICSKKFTRKAHLKRHLRIHDPEKPFKCPLCDYRGCERSDITKHLLVHDTPKHVCEVCGKAFRHLKNKDLHVKRHKGQRDYKCGVCDFYGYTFTDIRKHIERKHAESTSKTVVCDKCGSAFKNEISLKEHQKGQCELIMIEQALAAEGPGDAPTTIQIAASQLGPEGHIMVDGNQVNITVEHVALPDDMSVGLSECQMEADDVTEGHVLDGTQVDMSQLTVDHTESLDDSDKVELDGETVEMDTGVVLDEAEFRVIVNQEEDEDDEEGLSPHSVAMMTIGQS